MSVEQHDPSVLERVLDKLTCSVCGREWSADTDGKWPIRVTATDPPRVTAHCMACAESGVGFEARGCATEIHAF